MKNDKSTLIAEAVVTIAFGIIVAIFGERSIDLYLGIVCIIAGIGLGVLAALGFKQTKIVPFMLTFGAIALLTIGICALAWDAISFGFLVNFILLAVGALGLAMILHGISLAAKKILFTGIGEIVVGVLAIVFVILYFTVKDFKPVVWICIGVAIAVYGLLELITLLTGKKLIAKK